MTWDAIEAKNRLSEILDRARQEGPQRIQRQDGTFLVLPEAAYKLSGNQPSFKDWLLNGPNLEGVDLTREDFPIREIDP